jgi:dynein light intermediate chain, axonemal
MTIAAYETLYESSIAYGVRKALVAEQKKLDLDSKLKELSNSKRELQQQVENLKATIELTMQRAKEKRELEEKAHIEDVERLTRANEELKKALEALLSAPKK